MHSTIHIKSEQSNNKNGEESKWGQEEEREREKKSKKEKEAEAHETSIAIEENSKNVHGTRFMPSAFIICTSHSTRKV